jgi:flagellar biosynthesis protein
MATPSRRRPVQNAGLRHLKALALQYDKTKMAAPRLTAKGQGQLAERMVELARRNGVPVREDRFLLESLEGLDVGQDVPPELYHVVAEILVAVYRAEREAGR